MDFKDYVASISSEKCFLDLRPQMLYFISQKIGILPKELTKVSENLYYYNNLSSSNFIYINEENVITTFTSLYRGPGWYLCYYNVFLFYKNVYHNFLIQSNGKVFNSRCYLENSGDVFGTFDKTSTDLMDLSVGDYAKALSFMKKYPLFVPYDFPQFDGKIQDMFCQKLPNGVVGIQFVDVNVETL